MDDGTPGLHVPATPPQPFLTPPVMASPTTRVALLLAAAVTACDRATPSPPFEAVADVRQLMAAVIEPAADHYWDAVGTIEDEKGTTAIAPKSPAEWDAVRNSALVVAESGNLLMMASRARDLDAWMMLSREMIAAGRRSVQAAESRDPAAVFDAGAALYDTCTNCHAKYAVELQRPSTGKP